MSLYGSLTSPGPSGFGYASTAQDVLSALDLTGKTFLVTGCNSGLGHETLAALAAVGARVIGAARTEAKAAAACAAVAGDAVPLACELSEPDSVRAAVLAVQALGGSLDGIVANAGIMALPQRTLQHGYEAQFFTNHVGHTLLITGLLKTLSADGRVVMVSSNAHTRTYPQGIRLDDLSAARGYTPWGAYGQSKLANLLFARHLATRLPPGQTASSIHPGVIATNIVRRLGRSVQWIWKNIGPVLALKSIPEGAATQCYVAAHPDAARATGQYWKDCNVAVSSSHGQDDALAAALWEKTEAIIAGL